MEFSKPEILQTWIFKKYNPQGWHFSTEKIDIIKFKEDSTLDFINIEKGLIRSVNFEISKNNEIILDSNSSFGQIQLVNKNELIIQNEVGENVHERIYAPLPISQIEIPDSEVVPLIKSNLWFCEMENPKGKLDLTIRKNSKENGFDFQLEMKTNKKKIVLPTHLIMPAELKKVENCLFLSCQKPNLFGNSSEMDKGRTNYFIYKITENEIHLELGSKKLSIQIFKKEKS